MTAPAEVVAAPASPLDAFTASFPPTRTGPLYKVGLAVVAFAMVLLPLIYIALVIFAALAVVWHLRNDMWIFDGASGRGGLLRIILYLGPAVAGGILVFFMVKPFFAGTPSSPDPITLDPAKEPLLFSFVAKICALVGAPIPSRIDVDCQVNASASLRAGLWSKDLVLTIGLPLASGLNMREFAGVLAHEFGHFAQGAGMRLTFVIRKINFWFARVVYERDQWDLKLDAAARDSDWRLAIVLHAGRACVWLTRRILWALMHAGHAISCFMLRQMEFDADSYEAKLAGSDAFASTALRLRLLGVATNAAYHDVRQSWASRRLPENLPLLIGLKATALPADVHEKISLSAASEKTGWFDTHPCDADRVRAVERLNMPGVFRLTEPATGLFSDFGDLSKTVTRDQYKTRFELEFTEQNLMSADEIERESKANDAAVALLNEFYGEVRFSLHPLLSVRELPPILDATVAAATWRAACEKLESLRAEAERAGAECDDQYERRATLTTAFNLAAAGFRFQPKEFGLPEQAASPGDLEIASRFALEDTATAIDQCQGALDPFFRALRERVTIALQFSLQEAASDAARGEEIKRFVGLLGAVEGSMASLRELALNLPAFAALAQNRTNHSDPAHVDGIALKLRARLAELTDGIQQDLKDLEYPFVHARGRITVAEYARAQLSAENEWHQAYLEGTSHIECLAALHYRLVGKVLSFAKAGEKALLAQ